MQRFQKFLGRKVRLSQIKKFKDYDSLGITERYVPDEIDEFDEFEFGLGTWTGQEVVFILVLELGRLARISLGYIPQGASEDDLMAFTESQLEEILVEKGDSLESFFESILPV
jgi:hypothetical protein